ncbi:MAG: RAMP superfamily CRISPR-associated protein [Thermoproteota archaeon]|uniref:RAMP superfamily CRISPR-associated protein n=1 Tax=Thermofilum sp. TaxID=1961369 RepID=UPI00315FA513
MSYNLVLMLKLTTTKKLVIGSGGLTLVTKADVPFLRIKKADGKRVLFIPGSTVKGILRTSLIRIAHLLGFNNVNVSVYPYKPFSVDIVTSLFGGPSQPNGKITIDPCMVGDSIQIVNHVRINDKSRTAEEGGLFSVEYLPIGSSFKTRIEGRGLSLEESRALFLGILELKYERIGKSGLVDVSIIKEESKIPDELKKDPIITEIVEGIGR